MEARKKVSNDKLKYQRELRGWSQRKVADLIDTNKEMISRWECGERVPGKFYQEKLCAIYDSSAEELGFIEGYIHDVTNDSSQKDIRLDINDHSLIINVPAHLLPLSEDESIIFRKMSHLKTWLIDNIDDGTRLRWRLYYTSSNKLTSDGLANQITILEQLASAGGRDQTKTCRILAQNYQLAGSLARDAFRYTLAKEYFDKAQHILDVYQYPDMLATAIARQALVYLRQNQDHPEKALQLYREAAEIAKRAESYVKAYVLSGLAEALARNEYKDECYRTLDQAEQLLESTPEIPIEEDFAYVSLTLQSVKDARGECYVILGDADKGLEYLQAAKKQVNQKMSRNYCRLLMQHAEAFFASGQPDQCVAYALSGLEIARALESKSSMNWSQEIYQKLLRSRWKKEAIVDTLGRTLKAEMREGKRETD